MNNKNISKTYFLIKNIKKFTFCGFYAGNKKRNKQNYEWPTWSKTPTNIQQRIRPKGLHESEKHQFHRFRLKYLVSAAFLRKPILFYVAINTLHQKRRGKLFYAEHMQLSMLVYGDWYIRIRAFCDLPDFHCAIHWISGLLQCTILTTLYYSL